MKVKKSMIHRNHGRKGATAEPTSRPKTRPDNSASALAPPITADPWKDVDLDTVGGDTITIDAMTMAGIRQNKGLLDMIIDGIDQGLLGYRDSRKEPVYVFDGNEDESVGHFSVYSKGSTLTMLQANAGMRAYLYNMLGKANDESEVLREQALEQLEEMQSLRRQGMNDVEGWIQCGAMAACEGAETQPPPERASSDCSSSDDENDDDCAVEEDGAADVRELAAALSKQHKSAASKGRKKPARPPPPKQRPPVPTGGAITIHNAEDFFQALSLRNALLAASARHDEEEEERAAKQRQLLGGGGGAEEGRDVADEGEGRRDEEPQPPTTSLSDVRPLEAIMVTWQSRTKSHFGLGAGVGSLDENIEATDMNISKSYFSGASVSVEDDDDDPGGDTHGPESRRAPAPARQDAMETPPESRLSRHNSIIAEGEDPSGDDTSDGAEDSSVLAPIQEDHYN